MRGYVHMCAGGELQTVVNCLMWVLETEIKSSARAVCVLYYLAIPPAPKVLFCFALLCMGAGGEAGDGGLTTKPKLSQLSECWNYRLTWTSQHLSTGKHSML